MNIFFTSDLHFNSPNVLKYGKRNFKSLEEMNKTILNNFNSKVTNNDIVYILGDFAEGKESILEYANKINGKVIYLLLGNYERSSGLLLWKDELPEKFKIIDKRYYFIEDLDVEIMHEPTNKVNNNIFYLFGHVHKLSMIKVNGLNVGVDCHNFFPIDLKEINFYRNAIANCYDQNVFVK